jgi:hypothetical protein
VLSRQGRPEIIDRWISSGRKTWPVIEDVSLFAGAWRQWWVSLQPKARVQGRGRLVRVVDRNETWEELKKGSVNGFFNVVVSLAWWYESLKTSAHRKAFMDMVDDVLWVQDQLLATLQPEKRKQTDDDMEVGVLAFKSKR